jgi:hypothetical protein
MAKIWEYHAEQRFKNKDSLNFQKFVANIFDSCIIVSNTALPLHTAQTREYVFFALTSLASDPNQTKKRVRSTLPEDRTNKK